MTAKHSSRSRSKTSDELISRKKQKSKLTLLHHRTVSNEDDSGSSDDGAMEHRIGFAFKKRREPVNWRLFSGIQVERVFRQGDVEVLQEVLDNLTFCDIESEGLRVDQSYVKIFQLAQMTIEYLLYSQDYLKAKYHDAERECAQVRRKLDQVDTKYSERDKEWEDLIKENRQLKKTVYAYQLWSKTPGGLSAHQPVAATYHRCRYCTKVFNTEYYLEGHLVRRHPEKHNYIADMRAPSPSAPPPIDNQLPNVVDKMAETMERFSTRVAETEAKMRAEMEERLAQEINKKERSLEEARRAEKERFEHEFKELRETMLAQLEQERSLLQLERQELSLMAEKFKNQAQESNVGQIESDNEDEKIELVAKRIENKYDEALSKLHDMLNSKLHPPQDDEKLRRVQQEKEQLEQLMGSATQRIRDLENALLAQKEILSKPISPTEQEVVVPKKVVTRPTAHGSWNEYVKIMDGFKFTPIPRLPVIKTRYYHSLGFVGSKKDEVKLTLEEELARRGITPESVQNADAVSSIIRNLSTERTELDKSVPLNAHMRGWIIDQLAEAVKTSFKMKPLKPPCKIRREYQSTQKPRPWDNLSGLKGVTSPKDFRDSQSRRSMRSNYSDVDWDGKSEVSFTTADVSEASSPTSRVSSPFADTPRDSAASSPVKPFNFMKGVNIFKPKTQRKEEPVALKLDPKLQQAVGHVEAASNAVINEEDEDEFNVSDLSDEQQQETTRHEPVVTKVSLSINTEPAPPSNTLQTRESFLQQLKVSAPSRAETKSYNKETDDFDISDILDVEDL